MHFLLLRFFATLLLKSFFPWSIGCVGVGIRALEGPGGLELLTLAEIGRLYSYGVVPSRPQSFFQDIVNEIIAVGYEVGSLNIDHAKQNIFTYFHNEVMFKPVADFPRLSEVASFVSSEEVETSEWCQAGHLDKIAASVSQVCHLRFPSLFHVILHTNDRWWWWKYGFLRIQTVSCMYQWISVNINEYQWILMTNTSQFVQILRHLVALWTCECFYELGHSRTIAHAGPGEAPDKCLQLYQTSRVLVCCAAFLHYFFIFFQPLDLHTK